MRVSSSFAWPYRLLLFGAPFGPGPTDYYFWRPKRRGPGRRGPADSCTCEFPKAARTPGGGRPRAGRRSAVGRPEASHARIHPRARTHATLLAHRHTHTHTHTHTPMRAHTRVLAGLLPWLKRLDPPPTLVMSICIRPWSGRPGPLSIRHMNPCIRSPGPE